MNKFKQYWIDLPAEEKANTLTHLFPLAATFAIVVPLIRLAWQAQMAQP